MRKLVAAIALSGLVGGCERETTDHLPDASPQLASETPEVQVEERCIQLIRESSRPGGCDDPLPNIRAVNALVPLGKDRALRILRKAFAFSPTKSEGSGGFPSPVFTVARLAFVPRDKSKPLRAPRIGSFGLVVQHDSPHWGLFPFVMIDDIPFDLSQGLMLEGLPESTDHYLDYLEKEGDLRAEPLVPSDNPLISADSVFSSGAWKDIRFEGNELNDRWFLSQEWVKMTVRRQALGLIRPVYNENEDIRMLLSHKGEYPWNAHLTAVSKLKPLWDKSQQRYMKSK